MGVSASPGLGVKRLVFALAVTAAQAVPAAAQGRLVVVTGLSGTPGHAAAFDSAAALITGAARTRIGIVDSRILRLGENTSPPVTAASLIRSLEQLSGQAEPGSALTVVLIGHGSALSGEPLFHLPGPDLSAGSLARALARFGNREIAVIAAFSASGDWIEALSGPRRTIITATRSAGERDATVFPRALADAFSNEASDLDRDGRLSLLELFEHARLLVERHYRDARRLRTEHALLESDGDGHGSLAPVDQADGRRAGLVFLDGEGAAAADDGSVAVMLARRDSLYRALAALRESRSTLDTAAYESSLETLVIEIARNGHALRARRSGSAP